MSRTPHVLPRLALATLLVALAVLAQAPSVDAQAGGAPSLVGAWLGVFPEDESGEAPGRVLATAHADGTLVVATTPSFLLTGMGPAARLYNTPGHGAWVADGERRYRARFVILFFDATGAYVGMQEITSALTLAADGLSATSRDSGRVVLADGTVAERWEDEEGPSFTRIQP